MSSKCSAVLLNVLFLVRALSAHECTPCNLRTCPAKAPHGCEGGRILARDPCGCCDQCARLEWEPCGGQDWAHGYCALGLTCASFNTTGAATIPEIGVCKVLPENPEAGLEDERCPLMTGCDRAGGQCVCDARHSCLGTFTYPDQETCMKASKSEGRRHDHRERHREKYVGPSNPACMFSGCNLTAEGCVCESQSCHHHFAYINRSQCQEAAEELRCAGVTCPALQVPSCPKDSVLTKSYTPPAGCCPSILPQCTCDLRACHKPQCPSGQRAVPLSQASGQPGDCCDVFECQKVSPKCVHNGKEFSEGEVYRMDPCWLCQCRGGISFCSKAECAELDCENFYIPEGECCPVCLDVELLSVDSTKASCWVNNKLRAHEEQWKEDDCTFCQCVDGEPHCTAMACKQSCQNPVKIPGECCPFCEEPSYETVSPMLCPPLENCSLSGNDCPYGFQQDKNGCLLCQCLNNDSCPDLGKYCSLQCPMGYERDDFGCEVCECSIPMPKCRPLTCTKTCPYGYVRNKHGCEMCRCVKCPPFTCDKHCSDGYRQNRKGCSICMCKESGHVPSTTAPSPMPNYCLTSNGHRYEEGDGWHDGCRDCYCHSGREMCVLISCPVPSCSHPVVRPDQCCPTCEDESGSGQPEGMDMVVCRAPGGEFYVEGETWNLDECTRCTCRKGRVLCDTEVCPPALCQTPIRNKDTCCHVCPDETLSPLLPVNNSQQEYCITNDGDVLLAGDSWKANACTSCTCNNGTIQCFSQHCPAANCRVPVLRKGQCCPHCLEITTSVPVMVATNAPKKTVTITVESAVWITTVTVPPIIADTDEPSLGENYPSQTEMALIYQSAAWILAGLLLAIIIFLIVALLVNKKKKWVQMSCYSAPKKTVILKKHVNKNSVVYMEPSKENKFQNVFLMSTMHSSTYLGTLIAGGMGSLMLDAYGWESMFYVTGFLSGLWALMVWQCFLKGESAQIQTVSKKNSEGSLSRKLCLKLLSKPSIWAMVFAHMCMSSTSYTLLSWLPTYFKESFPEATGWVYNVIPWLTAIPSALCGGYFSDHLISQGYHISTVRKIMQFVAMGVSSMFVMFLVGPVTFPSAVLFLSAAIGATTFTSGGVSVNVQDLTPSCAGALYGFMNMMGSFAGLVMVSLSGYLIEVMMSWKIVFSLITLVNATGLGIFLIFGDARRVDLQDSCPVITL